MRAGESIGYWGTYARFTTTDKRTAGAFLGTDNIIGDAFSVEVDYASGKREAWIVNLFGVRMGVLEDSAADQVELCNAKGWTVVALLALVAFSEEPEPGQYWGEVALIAYDPAFKDAFEPFVAQFEQKLGNGVRGSLDLGAKSLQELMAKQGDWFPTGRQPLPEREAGTAFVKTERSGTERLVDQARKGNKGCMVASWVFLLAIVALVVWALKSCGAF